VGSWTANEKVASLTRVPPPPTCRVSQLTAGAFAPHRAFVNFARNVTLRVARIPRVRSLLRRKWPIWGRILLKNKMRAEVTSYRMAVNEAWEALEGTLPQDTLAAMREAESVVAGYGYGVQSQSSGGGGNAYAYDDGGGGGGGLGGGGMMSSDGRGAGIFNRRDGGGGETDYYGEALSGMIRRRSSGRLNGRLAAATEDAAPALVDGGSYPVLSRAGSGSDGDSPTRSGGSGRRRGGGGNLQLVAYNGANGHHGHHHHKRRSQGALAKITGVAKVVTHHSRRLFINAPSTLVGVLTGREHGAELFAPHGDRMERLFDELGMDTRCAFTRAQRAAFLLQYNGDVSKAALAMERSLKWRKKYRFIPDKDLKRFEDVVFVHGGRHAYTGGVHLVLRLSAVSAAERSEGLDAVAAALISHVEAQWRQLHVHGDNPGKMRGRLVALVDCAGVTTTSFPASLVAHTLVTLDHNYPELAAEVHVVNVWWLVKRGLAVMLEATSQRTRNRVRMYKNDDTGADKLAIRFNPHALPSCFSQGRCACKTCKRMIREGKWGSERDRRTSSENFEHGGMIGQFRRWQDMTSAQRRQWLRHQLFYYLGLTLFWPMHVIRLNIHPVLVGIIRAQSMARRFFWRLRRGDPVAAFAATVAAFASLAFFVAVVAWWAEYGSTLLMESARSPPRTWEEAWEMKGMFQRSIGDSVKRSLGMDG
jgi:hypothetical protein